MNMLSRIANHLFWMARYLERSEHLARYIRVQYFSSLDAPETFSRESALHSMLSMLGGLEEFENEISLSNEEKILFFCCLDERNIYSIHSALRATRENALCSRDLISLESYEAINRLFHEMNKFNVRVANKERVYFDFCQHIIEGAYIVKGLFQNTLLRNQAWSIINIGIHLERAIQTTQILLSKFQDIAMIDPQSASRGVLQNYHWSTSLRSVGGFDMSRKQYRKIPNRKIVVDFLILNPDFPKSISHNLDNLYMHMDHIQLSKKVCRDSALFLTGKLASLVKYANVEEIAHQEEKYLQDLRTKLYQIGAAFEKQYLAF